MRYDKKGNPIYDESFNVVQKDFTDGLTEQNHKNECDINFILKKYARDGVLVHANKNAGFYDDIPSLDYQQAMDIVTKAQQMFQGLDGETRAKFSNSPVQFLKFVEDPMNMPQLQAMGLAPGVDGRRLDGTAIPGTQAAKDDAAAAAAAAAAATAAAAAQGGTTA